VDGDELTRLMLEHGVGVSIGQRIDVKRIDEDFFDE
jgi:restriction system protein